MATGPWLLDPSNQRDIERYLVERGLVSAARLPIAIQRAGDGNMNLALRLTPASGPSFVLKQGRPWVEKYPQIPAPFERTLVEAAFYTEVQQQPGVAALFARLVHLDAANHILALEDIGSAGDFTSIYANGAIPSTTVDTLLDWLTRLATVTIPMAPRELCQPRDARAQSRAHVHLPIARPERSRSERDHSRAGRCRARARS
jgi:5-methylthioribose kinase